MTLVILVADGARPDTLREALDNGTLPALAALRAEGGLHTVSSVFPSVTGPAYTPFLMGRYPGPVGLPGIRWWDRTHGATRWPDHARSYVGVQARHADADLDAAAPTLFELAPSSLASLTPLGRGLLPTHRLGFNWGFALLAAWTHFRGDVRGWLAIDRATATAAAHGVHRKRPAFAFIVHPGIDKVSHAVGHADAAVRDALRIVDDTAALLRTNAERGGYWNDMHLWVVSDHGHSPVSQHEDLAGLLASWGLRVCAHPWTMFGGPDCAVMVSGNAMSHVYLELGHTSRPFWPELAARWEPIAERLLERDSVDLLVLPYSVSLCEIRARARGRALVRRDGERYSYDPIDGGDPLGLGGRVDVQGPDAAHDACAGSDYPDALVQLAHLAGAPRSGEIILSAVRGWDFRARYEPIPHVSSHGALHREHMDVPLLLNRPAARTPRRTVDIMPSALRVLGLPVPEGLDGTPFL